MAAIGTSRLTALEEFITKGINNISLCENPPAKTKDCEDEFTCDFNSVFNFLLTYDPKGDTRYNICTLRGEPSRVLLEFQESGKQLTRENYKAVMKLALIAEFHREKVDADANTTPRDTFYAKKNISGEEVPYTYTSYSHLGLKAGAKIEVTPESGNPCILEVQQDLNGCLVLKDCDGSSAKNNRWWRGKKKLKRIYFIPNEYGFICKLAAIHTMEDKALDYLFPSRELPMFEKQTTPIWSSSLKLNERQRETVTRIMAKSTPHPFLIFGPPGTGKTTTVCEAILQVWKSFRNAKVHNNPLLIIVAAHSNTAIDLIVKSLLQSVPHQEILRLVSKAHYDNLDHSIRPIAIQEVKMIRKKLSSLKIICGTLDMLEQLRKLKGRPLKSSHMFVDEAGQATEAAISQIWPKYLKPNGQLILAGDPHQLGPTVKSKEAIYLGLHRSLMERLLSDVDLYKKQLVNNNFNDKFVIQLVQNYRSSHQLLEVPNKLFYDNTLVACAENEDILRRCIQFLPNKDYPIIFHQAYGDKFKPPELEDSISLRNHDEVNIVMKYVNCLIGESKFCKSDIGIISPYRGQVDSIKQRLVKTGLNKPDRLGKLKSVNDKDRIMVGTVDIFQGEEKKIIILTTVRSLKFTQSLGFLDSRHHGHQRFNVAVTRAKCLLIVVGDARLLQKDKNWKTLIKLCQNNASFLER